MPSSQRAVFNGIDNSCTSGTTKHAAGKCFDDDDGKTDSSNKIERCDLTRLRGWLFKRSMEGVKRKQNI